MSYRRLQISMMMRYLKFNDNDKFLIRGYTIGRKMGNREERIPVAVDRRGGIWEVHDISYSMIITMPSNELMEAAYEAVSSECRRVINIEGASGSMPHLAHLLKKFHRLGFLLK